MTARSDGPSQYPRKRCRTKLSARLSQLAVIRSWLSRPAPLSSRLPGLNPTDWPLGASSRKWKLFRPESGDGAQIVLGTDTSKTSPAPNSKVEGCNGACRWFSSRWYRDAAPCLLLRCGGIRCMSSLLRKFDKTATYTRHILPNRCLWAEESD